MEAGWHMRFEAVWLAGFLTAVALILDAGIGLKKPATVSASNPGVHGFAPAENHKPLKYFEKDKRKNKNQNQGKKKDFEMRRLKAVIV
jgi:hypothetical protein